MRRLNSRLLAVLLIAVQSSAFAAAIATSPIITTPMVAAPPSVSGFTPAGTCIGKGSTLTVQGSNFGTASGKGVALGGNGIHVDLPVASWSNTSIVVTIPNDSRIEGGKTYYIGIEKVDHSQWLSNINRTIQMCSGTVGMLALPPSKTFELMTPGRTGPSRGTTETDPKTTEGEPTASDGGTPVQTPSVPTNAGGSLLGGQLPEPPKDVPPAPPKESTAVEPAEIMVVSSNMAEAQQLATQAQALRLAPKRRNQLGGLGFVVTVFRVPKEMSVGDALLALRRASPNAWADANHRFQLMGDDTKTYGQKLVGWSGAGNCGAGIRVGMIDTAIDASHPKIRGRQLQQREFLSTGATGSNAEHGTATAGLLIGQEVGLVPGVQLYAANVFRDRGGDVDTTAESVVLGLNWLVESRVNVINLSLGGPRNLLIEAAIQRILDTGVAIVAAAGNSGDGAPPVFPAAQPGVIAVTAIDASLSPYKKASRGDYISFAAPGVDVWTTAPGKDGVFVSGTSYAAPFVTAALAVAKQGNGKAAWAPILKQMQTKARDLGAPGKDSSFGWGLVQAPNCTTHKF
jgi:hypothetical protein